ncbi:MAG: DUF3857 domain-containing protein [Bacteroidota bacterium]
MHNLLPETSARIFLYAILFFIPITLSAQWANLGVKNFSTEPYKALGEPSAVYQERNAWIKKLDQKRYLVEDVYVRLHILTDEAVNRLSTVEIIFDKKDQPVSKIEARASKLENGKVVINQLDADQFIESEIVKGYQKILIPLEKVKAGSIIEYRYRKKWKVPLTYSWDFQLDDPVLSSKLTLPNGISFPNDLCFRGINPSTLIRNFYNEGVEIFLDNIPALKEESFVPNVEDYRKTIFLRRLYIETANRYGFMEITPDGMKNMLHQEGYLCKYLKSKGKLLAKYEDELGEGSPSGEFMKKCLNFVHDHVTWNGEYAPVSRDQFSLLELAEKPSINSAEKNLILIDLLRSAGFEAYPLLTSTLDYGRAMPRLSRLYQFNHLIAYVRKGGTEYFLDATSSLPTIEMVPLNIIGQEGWLLMDVQNRWKQVYKDISSRNQVEFVFQLHENGTLEGKGTEIWVGYEARRMQERFKEDPKRFKEAFRNPDDNVIVKEADWSLMDSKSVFLSFQYAFESQGMAQQMGNLLIIDPFLPWKLTENPFESEDRQLPFDFQFPSAQAFNFELEIPKGYVVESLPKSSKITIQDKSMVFIQSIEVKEEGRKLKIISAISRNQYWYRADKKDDLKIIFDEMRIRQSEPIILKKK